MDNPNNGRAFKDIPLRIPVPEWNSQLARTILELEKLRVKKLGGKVPPYIFFQLQEIFQKLESLGSARIEGNQTILADLVEKIIDKAEVSEDIQLREITNLEKAIEYIEKNVKQGSQISRALVSNIHKIIVDGLKPPPLGEGSNNPGELRKIPVAINKSKLVLPDPTQVQPLFQQLLDFINQDVEPQNDLLVTAVAHHRMTWVHPFDNGNGRVVRLFTYALLIKQGFRVGRILNPTAIFCLNRDKYVSKLSGADDGTEQGMNEWCFYVLDGLLKEIQKIDRLLDRDYLVSEILSPALLFALDRKQITQREFDILRFVLGQENMTIKSVDLHKILKEKLLPTERSRVLRLMKSKEMLYSPGKSDGRIYTIRFSNSYLLRGVVKSLEAGGFVPASLKENAAS